MVIEEFRKLAYFEFLKEWIFTDEVKEYLGSNSFLENAGVMALGISLFVVALVCFVILFIFGKRFEAVRGVYIKLKKLLFWNLFIRYVLQSTLKLQMSACAVIIVAYEVSKSSGDLRRRLSEEASDNSDT